MSEFDAILDAGGGLPSDDQIVTTRSTVRGRADRRKGRMRE
jgi:hypothetical protein